MNDLGISCDERGKIGLNAKSEVLARSLAVDKLIARHLEEFDSLLNEQRKMFLKMASTLGLQPSANA